MLGDLIYMWKPKRKHLTEKEIRFVVTRGGVKGQVELDEPDGQKVQTSSCKVSKY